MSSHVICYDIRCPRRLQRIHRILVRHAFPIAYSVFLYEGTDSALEKCLDLIRQTIDPTQDDVRCYPLPERGLKIRIGKATLPAGITCTSLPSTFMI